MMIMRKKIKDDDYDDGDDEDMIIKLIIMTKILMI